MNEVDIGGKVVQYTKNLPDLTVKEAEPEPLKSLGDSKKQEFCALVGEEILNRVLEGVADANPVEILCPAMDEKIKRTQIHQFIRENFKGIYETDSVNSQVRIWKKDSKKRPLDADDRSARRFNKSIYLFHLYKENRDTMDVLSHMARIMKVKSSCFSFAGTKDKRAITVQQVTSQGIDIRKLVGLSSINSSFKMSDFRPVETMLQLGDLKGNRFSIVLRKVDTANKSEIEASLSSLKASGFINYFGMQRFGNSSSPTHLVGKALFESKWSDAVHLILKVKDGDSEDAIRAKKIWLETQDSRMALDYLPKSMVAERQLLEFFSNHSPNDHLTALLTIKRELRLLYLHSYQSFIWNSLASARMQFGKNPIIGDVVSKNNSVCVIENEEDLSKYQAEDIVIPLPGDSVIYPNGAFGKIVQDFLAVHWSFTPSQYTSLKGDYRKLFAMPSDVTWRFISYKNEDDQIIPNDLNTVKEDFVDPEEGPLNALLIQFTLSVSSYATMALREAMKLETDASIHKSLSSNSE